MTQDSITRVIHVPGDPAQVWDLFVHGFARWWPAEHSFCGAEALDRVFIDLDAGLWGERRRDGSVLNWGAVGPVRAGMAIRLGWQLEAHDGPWTINPDPARGSLIDVTLDPVAGGTRLTLSHHGFSRQGEGLAEAMRAVIIGLDRWADWLGLFAAHAQAEALARAVAEAESRLAAANPLSEAEFTRACAVMPGGNTRTSLFHGPFPLRFARGEGCRLTDLDGHERVDLLGEYTSGLAGHSPAPLRQAIAAALEGGLNLSGHTALETRLAEGLCARIPSFEKVRFTNSGTEANLMALAAAKAATGRARIVVFEGAYHGGVLAFGGGGLRVLAPHDWLVLPYDDIAAAEAAFAREGGQIAAVLVEPMLGAGGCRPASPEFLARLRALCGDAGAVLIFDEVQTSRLSPGGRQEVLRILPDMTTIGKYFGGGLAFGAFGGKAAIMDLFDPRRPDALMHAGTFNNNTLAMAAGLAALDLVTPEALARLNARGEALQAALGDLFAQKGAGLAVSGLGSILTIHPTTPDAGRAALQRRLLHLDLLEAGFVIAPRGLIALSLPVGEAEIAAFLQALAGILDQRGALLA